MRKRNEKSRYFDHIGQIILLLLTGFLSTSSVNAGDVTFRVNNGSGAGVASASLYIVRFTTTGPSGSVSRVATTGADGTVVVTLQDGVFYDVFASFQNLGPTARTQNFNPEHLRVTPPVSGTQIITLNETYSDRGTITANITNGTPNSVLFGNVRKISTGKDLAFAACTTNGSGACAMVFHNIPAPAEANTYDVSAFDPQASNGLGKGNGGQLNQALTVGGNGTMALDLVNGLPPDLSANEGSRSHDAQNRSESYSGGASVEGVVEDIDYSTITIPHGHLDLQVLNLNGTKFINRGTGVDQNGRFKFFGLEVGTTYYVRHYGGCTFSNLCYNGYESTTTALGINDFYYDSSATVKILRVKLTRAAAGTAVLPVYVRDSNGRLLPGSNIHLGSDGSPWHSNPNVTPICDGQFHNADQGKPGFANVNVQATTGYALITGLRPGNYTLRAWSQFSNNQDRMFNAGPDGIFNWGSGPNNHRGCFAGSYDDLRLTIEDNNSISVYNTTGTAVVTNASSITIVMPLTVGTSGVVQGTLTFPQAVDLRSQPITLAFRNCDQNGCRGNFTVIGDDEPINQTSYNYSVQLATATNDGRPASYFMEIQSTYWGWKREGHDEPRITFSGGGTVTKNFEFAPAGRAQGKVYKPDGSLLKPGPQPTGGYLGASINAQGITVDGWRWGNVLQDGSFDLGGMLPGEYALSVRIHGGSDTGYANTDPVARVIVAANADSYKDVKLVEGEKVLMHISTASTLPTLVSYVNPQDPFRGYSGEFWEAQKLPLGTPFTPEVIGKVLDEGFGEESRSSYLPPSGNEGGPCGPNFGGGFCPKNTPSNTAYDYFLFRRGDLDSTTNTYMYMTLVDAKRNVRIDRTQRSLPAIFVEGSTITPVRVTFAPSGMTAGTTVEGTVLAQNVFREEDFKGFGGDFNNFVKFIPVIALYEANGDLKAAGFVTPGPEVIADDSPISLAIDRAIQSGNFQQFKQATEGLTWKYQIRGVPENKPYTLVGTTPNYPPFIQKIATGALGSTVTVNFNWDTQVGAGATMTGVVRTTATVAIANASVIIQTQGHKTKTLATDAQGVYRAEGLPLGSYKITASADGYAPFKVVQDITTASTVTVNITLTAAQSSISGTVRELTMTSRGPVIKPVSGARVFAYNDTLNVASPTVPLALVKAQTGSNGDYTLKNLIANNVYKIFVRAPGRYLESLSTTTVVGELTGVDFNLKQKPLDIQVFARPNPPNYEFHILNPNNFESGRVWYGPASNPKTTEISDSFRDLPDGSLVGSTALSNLSSTVTYSLHIEAVPSDGSPLVTRQLLFGVNVNNNAERSFDSQLIGDDTQDEAGVPDNRVGVRSDGNGASCDIETGAIIQNSQSSIPNLKFTEASTASLSGGQAQFTGQFKGSVFDLTFSSVQFTGRNVRTCFTYNSSTVSASELASLAIFRFNPTSGQWEPLSGQVTIDPLQGLACMGINPLTLIQSESPRPLNAMDAASQGRQKTVSMAAASDGMQFMSNPRAAATGSGSFMVGIAASTGVANPQADKFKQYNFPNPFDLKDKTVTLRTGTTGVNATIRGTYIVVAPVGSGTVDVKIRIYNMAGDLVREIKDTGATGFYNYYHWDGKNNAGDDVASGVYFAVVDAPGAPKKEPIKMVLVK